jgi:dTDP-4-dehydrorhamnose reductase
MARCEAQPEQTRRFNVHNTLLIAEKLVANGAFLVFLSTSQVFDGSVPCRKFDDPVCPRTQYGSQKAEVEQRLLSLGNTIAVVRFTKVIGPDNSLIHGWMQTLQEGRPIRPFADAVMSPLPLTFAVDVLDLVVCKKSPGIFQVSGEQDITYEEAARYVARCLHASCDLIRPVSSQQSGLPSAFFPAHTTLDMSRLRLEVGLTPPDTWAALDLAVNP